MPFLERAAALRTFCLFRDALEAERMSARRNDAVDALVETDRTQIGLFLAFLLLARLVRLAREARAARREVELVAHAAIPVAVLFLLDGDVLLVGNAAPARLPAGPVRGVARLACPFVRLAAVLALRARREVGEFARRARPVAFFCLRGHCSSDFFSSGWI